MYFKNRFLIIIIALISDVRDMYNVDCSNILGIFPFKAKSHYVVFEPLLLELSKRGHNLTVVTPFSKDVVVPNFNVIDASSYLDKTVNAIDISSYKSLPIDPIHNLYFLLQFDNITKVFDIPGVKKLLDTDGSYEFDLIITELFNNDVMLGFANRFKAPVIALSSCDLPPWGHSRFGNPDNPSYIPAAVGRSDWIKHFLQRVYNTVVWACYKLVYDIYFYHKSEFYVKKYFGENVPPLYELVRNTSLVLINSHYSLHGSKPKVPALIEVGGINILPLKQLPKDLEKFINESEHGVIYFCMGSMLKASTLPEDKRLDIVEVFSKLPQRVLWKWETETMPDKPDNVKLLKWMPQRDVLAHPNIKMFISHGGLLGTTEAVYSAVPIIGMPFYGDQGVNIEAVQAAGAGIRLDFKDLNKDSLYKAIRDILDNPKYKENAIQLSERFKDRPQTPLETAVYWTEYVIRHKGAPHLRSAAVDLTWYQYLLLDVIAFLLVSVLTILTILYYIIKQIGRFVSVLLFKSYDIKTKSKQKNQ